jgi:hypothetical protein
METAMIIHSCKYHRNGVAGAGFYAFRLSWRADGRRYTGSAIVFDASEHVAVTSDGGVGFRCEDFEAELRAFIASPAGEVAAFS